MDARVSAEIESLCRTEERLERAGLVMDRASLSPNHRRAFFALQRRMVDSPTRAAPNRALIGFPYASSARPQDLRAEALPDTAAAGVLREQLGQVIAEEVSAA